MEKISLSSEDRLWLTLNLGIVVSALGLMATDIILTLCGLIDSSVTSIFLIISLIIYIPAFVKGSWLVSKYTKNKMRFEMILMLLLGLCSAPFFLMFLITPYFSGLSSSGKVTILQAGTTSILDLIPIVGFALLAFLPIIVGSVRFLTHAIGLLQRSK